MFNVSLADRLKAAVNTLEQTGSSLQARAIGQGQGQPLAQSPTQASTSLARSVSPGNASSSTQTVTGTSSSADAAALATSPTRNYSTSQLAENALSGLRKSFNFNRDGAGHARTASSPSGGSSTNTINGVSGQQELKDISSPNPNTAGPSSRSSSPAPVSARLRGVVGGGNNFALGSDPSSITGTPRSRSPIPTRSPRTNNALPAPDPEDPATYPLPPSPSLAPTHAQLLSPAPVSASGFADPLGASPSLSPVVPPEPPILGLQSPTPDIEKTLAQAESSGARDIDTDTHISESVVTPNPVAPAEMDNEVVKKVEEAAHRYEDMSLQYTALLAQVENANKVIRDLTPLAGGVQDAGALEDWIRMQNGKVDLGTEELKRLQSKLTQSRIEELRDTHRLEGTSQTELVTKLRSQLSTAEQNLASKATELMQLGQMRAELTKAQTQAKEEEEKRTKAISLLKTVRQKLVKAEKDREEVERDRAEERAERSRAVEELERTKAEREREVNNLRKGFERELSGVKERYEKDLQAKKAAWELEMITTKASHAKELSSRMSQVSGLEAIVQELNLSKQQQFEMLESRQSEVDTARAQMEAMQNSTKELEYQLRETTERCSLLEDQLNSATTPNARSDARGRLTAGARSARDTPSPSPSRQNSYSASSAAEVQRLLAEAESRSEAKMADLRHKIRSLENERNDAEEEWANKLQERVRESEKLRRAIAEKDTEYNDVLRTSREKEHQIGEAEERRKGLERELNALRTQVEEAKGDMSTSADAERSARDEISNLQAQISTLNAQLEDAKTLSTQLRQTNRTLREEMRKVQSSVQLMERSRNPGVGYWSSISNAGPSTTSVPAPRSGVTSPGAESMMGTPTKESSRRSMESLDTRASPAPSAAPSEANKPNSKPNADEEEVNLEYLRNVILQFLENKEMRPNLVRVLSVILRFTPQELRRLNAKLLT